MTPQKIPPPIRVYGGDYRGKCPKEGVEQVSWFNRIRREYPDTYGILAVHIRNEDRLATARNMQRHKLEGLTVGAADIFVPGAPSLVIEMKRLDPTQSTMSDEQECYLLAAAAMGSWACVAFGAVAAWEAFEEWRVVVTPTPA